MAGLHAAAFALGETPRPLPRETALGSLCHYVSAADPKDYQPANITFDLLPHSTRPRASACAATRKRATPTSAGRRSKPSTSIAMPDV